MSKLSLGVQEVARPRAEMIARPDVAIGTVIDLRIPDTIPVLTGVLDSLGGAIAKGGWWTAAAVYAWTEPGKGGPRTGREIYQLSEREFAELGLRGLTSRDSVHYYRSRWEDAIEAGWAQPVKPGDDVILPEQDFRAAAAEADEPGEMAHVGQNTGENEWYTPEPYIRAAVRVMGAIDLDPASSDVANEIIGAAAYFTVQDDGLAQPWQGRVWMNPPYAQPLVGQFCGKLAEEVANGNVSEAVVLVNNATETVWFQRMPEVAKAICFPSGRVKFWHPERTAAPLQGQAVLYFGEHVREFCAEFAEFGFTVAIIG